jgi:hypothetical protein
MFTILSLCDYRVPLEFSFVFGLYLSIIPILLTLLKVFAYLVSTFSFSYAYPRPQIR